MSSIKITKRYYSSTATYTSKELFDIIKYKSHTCQVIHIEQTFDGNYRYVFWDALINRFCMFHITPNGEFLEQDPVNPRWFTLYEVRVNGEHKLQDWSIDMNKTYLKKFTYYSLLKSLKKKEFELLIDSYEYLPNNYIKCIGYQIETQQYFKFYITPLGEFTTHYSLAARFNNRHTFIYLECAKYKIHLKDDKEISYAW